MKTGRIRFITLLIIAALAVSFTGCDKKENKGDGEVTEQKEVKEKKTETKKEVQVVETPPELGEILEPFCERVCGKYSHKCSDDEYDMLEIVHFGNNLYAYAGDGAVYDVTGEIEAYSFWAVEFFPYSEDDVTDPYTEECEFNTLCFSIMSNLSKYWGAPQKVTLKITDDGLDWISSGEVIHYVSDERVESAFPMYDSSHSEIFNDRDVLGLWKQIDNAGDPYYIEFLPNDNVFIYKKDPKEEVFLAGGKLTPTDRKVVCEYKVLGLGGMEDSFAFTTKQRGYLLILEPDPDNVCSIDMFNTDKTIMFEMYRSNAVGSMYNVPTITYEDIVAAGYDENYVPEFSYNMEPDTWAGFYGVWVSASTDPDAAAESQEKLEESGFEALTLLSSEWSEMNSKPYYCVTAGRYDAEYEAQEVLERVREAGYKDAYVKYTGDRLINRVYYTIYSLDDVRVDDDMIILNALSITDPAMGSDSEYTKDLFIDRDTVFDKSADTSMFGNYEKGDTVYDWFKRNYEYAQNDPDKYMESGPALIGVFEISITDSHIDSYLGSYWWD